MTEGMIQEEQFKKDTSFLIKNLGEWTELYPNHWVIVYQEKLVAVTDDVVEYLQILIEANEENKRIVDYFLNTEPMILVAA